MLHNTVRRRFAVLAAAGTLAAVTTGTLSSGSALADDPSTDPIIANNALLANPVSDDGSKIVSTTIDDGQHLTLSVYSAAMDKNITVLVARPHDTSVPRPVLYLLNGAGGGQDTATWQQNTDVYDTLAQKDTNVVMPIGGHFSYYTDWEQDDPKLGRNMWRTFLLDELPPLVDGALGTNGVQAIAANSMTATSVLQLAEARPGFYTAVGAYSGCAQTSDPLGQRATKIVVAFGGGNAENMWGSDNDPNWVANDPVVHADQLRGTSLFISSGNGLSGVHDHAGDPFLNTSLASQVITGGMIEGIADQCTHNLQDKLGRLGIPATFDFTTGTHSWGYWNDAFYASWPQLAAGLGIDP